MKRLIIALSIIAFFVSCTSEEEKVKDVAEKGLTEFGNGKYRGAFYNGHYLNIELMNIFGNPLFADYAVENRRAEAFMKYGQLLDRTELRDNLFDTDYLFDDIKFVSSEKIEVDIYSCHFQSTYSDDMGLSIEDKEELRDHFKDKPGFYSSGVDYCYIEYPDTPYYKLTYKLDNRYVATVYVACVEDKEPEITSIFIRK